jgi:hypothetical protein
MLVAAVHSQKESADMALEDWLESEVAVAVAATTVVLSPKARRVLRRGAVYAVAGALKATDLATAAARGVAQGVSSESGSVPSRDGEPERRGAGTSAA